MYILGLSFFYHDSAAALLKDGVVVGAVQEERLSRKKYDNRFPRQAIAYLLKHAGITPSDIDTIAYYEDPSEKLNRIIRSYGEFAPHGFRTFPKVVKRQLSGNLLTRRTIRRELGFTGPVYFIRHHQSHAASAFFPSPFTNAAFLTLDGVGEWNTATFGVGEGNSLHFLGEINFPHSLGLLYSAFTYFTGFKVNSGEYKLMGLAPYGEPKYVQTILDNLIDLREDGSFALNLAYFDFVIGEHMLSEKFSQLFGRPPRLPESPLTKDDMDLARSIQEVLETAFLRLGNHVRAKTGERQLCMAGGVALNCVATGKLLRAGTFDDVWVQPAAGDAGGALGAALSVWHERLGNPLTKPAGFFFDPFLGPEFEDEEIRVFLDSNYIPYSFEQDIDKTAARLIADGNVVGYFQGRMEYGPRALGARSILGHPGLPDTQKKMNLKIKFRESFRPFAPAILEEKVAEWFEGARKSPYMLLVFPVATSKRTKSESANASGLARLNTVRSVVPAITHVDYSARIQTVSKTHNPRFYNLIKHFEQLTSLPLVVNTSFNVRGEPIVSSPEDAYRCFMRTDMDYLVLEHCLLSKGSQRPWHEENWKTEYELD